jgi:hypothetical protein
MRPTTTSSLRVPGADLYYEVRGSGPVLLLICGGVHDAAARSAGVVEVFGRFVEHGRGAGP